MKILVSGIHYSTELTVIGNYTGELVARWAATGHVWRATA